MAPNLLCPGDNTAYNLHFFIIERKIKYNVNLLISKKLSYAPWMLDPIFNTLMISFSKKAGITLPLLPGSVYQNLMRILNNSSITLCLNLITWIEILVCMRACVCRSYILKALCIHVHILREKKKRQVCLAPVII